MTIATAPQRPARPRVVAHRGSSSSRAEHTLGAYEQALLEGADALECDVRLTADGHLVCVHDRRIDRTSNGEGVVSTLELAELDALNWASWKSPWRDLDDEAPEFEREGRVLTLSRLLDLLHQCGRPVDLFIETKHPSRYAGLVEERVSQLLRERALLPQPRSPGGSVVRVMSFSWMGVRRSLALEPEIEHVLLVNRLPSRVRSLNWIAAAEIVGPSIELLLKQPDLVSLLHDAGRRVYTFTVNDPVGFELCLGLGVDFVATDKPAEALGFFTAH